MRETWSNAASVNGLKLNQLQLKAKQHCSTHFYSIQVDVDDIQNSSNSIQSSADERCFIQLENPWFVSDIRAWLMVMMNVALFSPFVLHLWFTGFTTKVKNSQYLCAYTIFSVCYPSGAFSLPFGGLIIVDGCTYCGNCRALSSVSHWIWYVFIYASMCAV